MWISVQGSGDPVTKVFLSQAVSNMQFILTAEITSLPCKESLKLLNTRDPFRTSLVYICL